MRIDQEKCVTCLKCIETCPVEAIKENPDGEVFIDEDTCVECGSCLRVSTCDAIWQPELEWPRRLRAEFSDNLWEHPSTGQRGRGTAECKTNDVTGHCSRGQVVIAAEMGRPSTGTSFRDVEKVTMALAPLGVTFEKENPVYVLITDQKTGKLNDEVLDERALSVIVEVYTTPDEVPTVLKVLRDVSQQVETVFSVDMCSILEADGTCAAEDAARSAGFELRPNGKNNIGLGHPLAKL